MADDDPVTAWLGQLKDGDPAAVRPLWDRYFNRLVGLARQRLRDFPRRAADEEDMALSAFESFCRHAESGRFPDLDDRVGLWRLLALFTVRKVGHYLRDESKVPAGSAGLGREPDPALAAAVAEECERLLAALPDPLLRRVAVLRMDGLSVDEIVERVGTSHKSVDRKLDLIRRIWKQEAGDGRG